VKLRRISRVGLAGLAVAALPLATACQTRIGAAADVGDQQIETSQVTAVAGRSAAALARSGSPVPEAQHATLQRGVLNLLVRDALLGQIGKARGITVSDREINAERAAEAQQAGGDAALVSQSEQGGVSATDIGIVIREKLLIQKLQNKFGSSDTTAFSNALTDAAKKVPVRINPRFGSWNTKTLTIEGAPNTLSSTITRK
jgi:hypothetical protein